MGNKSSTTLDSLNIREHPLPLLLLLPLSPKQKSENLLIKKQSRQAA